MSEVDERPIAVLALNPAVDISYEIPQLLEYQKIHATHTWYHPGGNGINVARALAELGEPVHCCSIIGGESGDLLLRLLGETLGTSHSWFRVQGETRINTTLLEHSPPGQYEIASTGPEVPPEVLEEATRCFLGTSGDGIAVLTGYVPPGVPEATYRDLAMRIKEQGGKAVIDSQGPVLQEALQAQPYMVRLNRYVLERSVKRRLDTLEQVAAAARPLQEQGIEFLCITLGPRGAMLVDANGSYHCSAPRVHKQSTVGAGDALVAGLVAAVRRGLNPEAMLRFGVICGSATAAHPGTELFTRAEVEAEPTSIEITSIDA
jgi:6-phosphofructokinase 2